MSRKGRKKGRSGRYRQPVRVTGHGAGGGAGTPATRPSGPPGRALELSLGARNQIVRGSRGRMVIQSGDPAIPLDRVPYFTKDLVRLAVVGAAMGVRLGGGWFVVPQLVK